MILVGIVWLIQLSAVNWGYEKSAGQPGSYSRGLSELIAQNNHGSSVVVIGAQHGRGIPGSLLYEIDGGIDFVVVTRDQDPELLVKTLMSYDDIWYVPGGGSTKEVEESVQVMLAKLGRRLREFNVYGIPTEGNDFLRWISPYQIARATLYTTGSR